MESCSKNGAAARSCNTRITARGDRRRGHEDRCRTAGAPDPSTLLPVLQRAKTRSNQGTTRRGVEVGGGGHVGCDEFGKAYSRSMLSRSWRDALAYAGLPPRVLARFPAHRSDIATSERVPIAVIAAVLVHTEVAFTQRTYADSQG